MRKSLTSAPVAAKVVSTWNKPSRLDPVQLFPKCIYDAMGIILQDHVFTSRYSRTTIDKLPASVKARVNCISVKQLRMADAMANKLFLSRSTIAHPKAGRGVFAGKEFGKDEFIAPFYGALVYAIPLMRPSLSARYTERLSTH